MGDRTESPQIVEVDVSTHGRLPGAAAYARSKIAGVARFTRRPVRQARVRLSRHADPAVHRPVVAQANLDVDGRIVRAQVEAVTAREAIDLLEARLRRRLERTAEHWEARRGGMPLADGHEWRHQSEPANRPPHHPRRPEDRQIIRRKSYTLAACSVDDAAFEMEMLDYDFHLFTEQGSGIASVLYRNGPGSYRLAQVVPVSPDLLAPFDTPVSFSPQPAPCITVEQATERMGLLDLPFLFFIDAAQGRASVLYHRYDGHYGLIYPAG
ncbi:MAG: sigma 54 modulation/S30EA ribosomal C-terminal domain-containing protein [Mycolicibacterium sp.]|uniref:sigma 54 modulation/S30EA ribosomal C-terminal domain-containing protein n=1 Tax=Mycolicibacterium sp. TaxID=2320850 RepID=UPI003D103EBE